MYRSLARFRELVQRARSPEALQAAVLQEFDLFQSVGKDGQGTVSFTGYFEPTYRASRTPTAEYRYPLYRLPNLAQWSKPQPTRAQLEGTDGLQGEKGRLRGLELVWLRDRLEAYLVQVQGSARLQLTDGTTLSVGVAGTYRLSLHQRRARAGQRWQIHPGRIDPAQADPVFPRQSCRFGSLSAAQQSICVF